MVDRELAFVLALRFGAITHIQCGLILVQEAGIAVEDFASTISVFSDELGMPVFDLSTQTVESLGAKLAFCTPEDGSNIEIMSPGNPDTPLSQSLQGFIDRRGEGHFALMLEAADPDLEAEGLLKRGLNVLPLMAGAGGRDAHPNSTYGVLIRIYPTNSLAGLLPPGQNADIPASALSGIQRVVLAVRDLNEALLTYGEKFALPVSNPVVDAKRGVRTALCSSPSGGVIELDRAAMSGARFWIE
ncbi:MAG: VOC family protein [Gammaproteobacteria bacterium]|nr:VOC family protein [Gammaproteobacteria bacterium]